MAGRIKPGAGNTIAYSDAVGVAVYSGTGRTIRGNSIFGNGGLGIDLLNDGVTPNDLGDPDIGPNNLQNFPLVTTITQLVGPHSHRRQPEQRGQPDLRR